MRKPGAIFKELENLKLETSKLFDNLLKQNSKFNFAEEVSDLDSGLQLDEYIQDLKETDGLELLPILEVRNSNSGNVFDVYITEVTENGVRALEMIDKTPYIYKFSDLLGIDDALVLLNEMEEMLER